MPLSISAAALNAGMFSLPQELFNQIHDLVFAAEPERTIDLDKDYKPPVQLQVDRASRAAFAKEYYGNNTFHIRGTFMFTNIILQYWTKGLPYEHRLLLQSIKLDVMCNGPYCVRLSGHLAVSLADLPIYKMEFFPPTQWGSLGLTSLSPGMSAWQVQMSYVAREGNDWVERCAPLGTRHEPPIGPEPKPKIIPVPDSGVVTGIKAALSTAIGYIRSLIGPMLDHKPPRQSQSILPLFRHSSINEW